MEIVEYVFAICQERGDWIIAKKKISFSSPHFFHVMSYVALGTYSRLAKTGSFWGEAFYGIIFLISRVFNIFFLRKFLFVFSPNPQNRIPHIFA